MAKRKFLSMMIEGRTVPLRRERRHATEVLRVLRRRSAPLSGKSIVDAVRRECGRVAR